jgi:putative two-component system response regulator
VDNDKEIARILIVDDQDLNLRLIEGMLTPMNYAIFFARDGIEALTMTKRISPDLILLDVMMPKMNGFELTRKLKMKEETRGIPIVIVTSLKDVEDRVRALDYGADDFLSKPVEKTELLARVKSLLKVKAYSDYLQQYQENLEKEVAIKTEKLEVAIEQIKAASLDTIFCLSRAAEYKDEETGNHIKRVSEFAALVATKIGLDEETVHQLRYAAPLHDIGKIGIPENILLKPGKLNATEWEIMKLHTIIGGRILKGSETDYLKMGENIALTHHEKWNGKGYPNGLRADEIPIEGRITAIVDVFDAITTKRPYRSQISLNEAFQYIVKKKGIHFDPEIVDAFLGVKEDILSVKRKLKEKGHSIFIRLNSGEISTVMMKKNDIADKGQAERTRISRDAKSRKSNP